MDESWAQPQVPLPPELTFFMVSSLPTALVWLSVRSSVPDALPHVAGQLFSSSAPQAVDTQKRTLMTESFSKNHSRSVPSQVQPGS